MKAFYTDQFVLPLPAGHRFPMSKYALLRQRVVAEGIVASEDLRVPEPATDEDLLRAHDALYIQRVATGQLTEAEIRRIGFPWSPGMVERSRRFSGATIAACRAALTDGVAVNLAGGTHHAFRDAGEGYCVFNDSAVAARALQADGVVQRVLVLDTDVHQGNGTAAILHDDPTIFTFSIHGAKNFPLRKEVSDLDVPLPDGASDADYLEALDAGVSQALDRAFADLVIFLSGARPVRRRQARPPSIVEGGTAAARPARLQPLSGSRLTRRGDDGRRLRPQRRRHGRHPLPNDQAGPRIDCTSGRSGRGLFPRRPRDVTSRTFSLCAADKPG